MATVVSTPQLAYRSTLIAGTAAARSSNLTIATSTGGWEIRIPFKVLQPNTALSAGWEAYAYRSDDAGNAYDTVASFGFSIAGTAGATDQKTITLDPGYWLIRIITGGNAASTWSCLIGTQEVITAVVNV